MWAVAAAAVALGIAAVVALTGDDDGVTTTETTRRTTTTQTESSATTAPTTAPDDTTTTLSPTTASPATTGVPTTATGLPPAVTVTAGPSAGSGEISVRWDAAAGATGYRVLRADTAGGTYSEIADINVTTGARTSAPEVTTIWSAEHNYGQGALTAPDGSSWFELIEYGSTRERCFQVVAYNAAGQGPASAPACGRSTT